MVEICLEKKAVCSIKYIMKIIGINYGECTPFAHIFIKDIRHICATRLRNVFDRFMVLCLCKKDFLMYRYILE